MKFILLLTACLILFVSPTEALEGKALYDYMCLFINTNINEPRYEKAIESIYASDDWIRMDAQYGPFIRPTPTPPQKK